MNAVKKYSNENQYRGINMSNDLSAKGIQFWNMLKLSNYQPIMFINQRFTTMTIFIHF